MVSLTIEIPQFHFDVPVVQVVQVPSWRRQSAPSVARPDVVDIPVVVQRLVFMVLTVQQTIELPQLRFIDKVFYVFVVQVRQIPRVQSVERPSSSHSCSSLLLDTVVHMPVCVQRQMLDGSRG